jgi:nucleotide-binding universal stress UspA family protein
MFRNIVVALDGSEVAEQVIALVPPLVARDGAVHLVRVVPGSSEPTALQQARVIEATSYLEFLKKEGGESFQTRVLQGEVTSSLVDHARRIGADLIALSPHGEGGTSRFVFGSVAGQLAGGAACPVLVAPPTQESAQQRGGRDRVMVALDGSQQSESVVPFAMELARHLRSTLLLLHVVEAFWAAANSAAARAQARVLRDIHRRMDRLAERMTTEGVQTLPLIVRGDPAAEILSQVDRRRVRLLCLSFTPRSLAGRLFFGSVAEKVAPKASVPLLLVRQGSKEGSDTLSRGSLRKRARSSTSQ